MYSGQRKQAQNLKERISLNNDSCKEAMARGDGGKDNGHEGHEMGADTGNTSEGTRNRIQWINECSI